LGKRTAYNKAYYEKNKERVKQVAKDWYHANQEYCLAYKVEQRRNIPVEQAILQQCQKRAIKRGIPFDLTIEDIVIPLRCPYLDIPLTYIQGLGHVQSNVSIDKIIPSMGYVKGNVRIISRMANQMKSNATVKQLQAFAEGIRRIHGST